MAEYLLNEGVSDNAQKSFDKLLTTVQAISKELDGKNLGSMAKDAAAVEKLTLQNEKLRQQIEQISKGIEKQNNAKKQQLTLDEKLAQQSQNAVLKLQATLTNQYASALQKLDAQIKLNVIAAQKYVTANDTQNRGYLELMKNTKQLSLEYDRLSKASGANMVKTNSMYGATFQLTQVMRELPNFAIDARIGFMALSNNLPMLMDSFQQLSKQIDVNTGKVYGNMGALKQFAKSLLSLNTIMIVASTLLVLFGKDMLDWIANVSDAEKTQREFTKSLRDANGVYTDAVGSITKVTAVLNDAKKGFVDGKDAVNEYNKSFGSLFGEVKTVEEALAMVTEKGEEYIQIMFQMQLANIFLANSNKLISEAAALAADDVVTIWQKAWNWMKNFGLGVNEFANALFKSVTFQFKAADNSLKQMMAFFRQGEGGAGEILAERERKSNEKLNKALEERNAYFKAMTKIHEDALKADIDLYPDQKDKKGRGDTVQTAKTIFVKEEYWNKKRAELELSINAVKLTTEKATTDGVLIEYDIRKKANEELITSQIALSEMELADAVFTADQKGNIEKRKINDQWERAKKLLAAGKITQTEAARLAEEYLEADATITKNHQTDIEQATLKHNHNLENFTNEHIAITKAIKQDEYADEIYMLQQVEKEKKRIADLAFEDEMERIKRGSLLSKIGNALGIKTPTKIREISATSKKAAGDNQITKETLEAERDNPNATGEQRLAAERKLAELSVKIKADEVKGRRDIELEVIQETENAKASVIADSIETIKSLWNSFYDYLNEKVENQQKLETKKNDERLAQFEDETEAGMHTAKELDDFKKRSADYQASIDEEAARKKEELDKQQFLVGQAMALAQIWINYGISQSAIIGAAAAAGIPTFGAATPVYLSTYSAWNLASAIAGSALIAAQTIPAFAEGGDMPHKGLAWLGDGGKHELAVLPNGNAFISGNTPEMHHLEKGTHIFPDINKVDIGSILALRQVQMGRTDNSNAKMEAILNSIDKSIKKQKGGNFYGMPLIRQMKNSERYSQRKKGLMN